jgi:hypothetical protein
VKLVAQVLRKFPVLWNPMFHHRVHKSTLLAPALTQFFEAHDLLLQCFKTVLSTSGSSKRILQFSFCDRNCVRIYELFRTCYVPLVPHLLDMIMLVVFAEEFIMRLLITVFITHLKLYIRFTTVLKWISFVSLFISCLCLLLSVDNVFIT